VEERAAAGVFLKIAVIGDYGTGGQAEEEVAEQVHAWGPDAVLTLGDNNYPVGAAMTLDAHVGAFYARYIHPYKGAYPPGATKNRFFPALGNHDWGLGNVRAHEDYFDLPGNERYYTVRLGDVAVFVLDSDPHEPDGIDAHSAQARWLREGLAGSDAAFRVVTMHHPPYSSGRHGSQAVMQWPFGEWGADLVLAGHDHTYERIELEGVTYVVNGLGGRGQYRLGTPVEGSRVRFNADHGVLFLEANERELKARFVTHAGLLVDEFRRVADAPAPEVH
jgi:hypothetical protein